MGRKENDLYNKNIRSFQFVLGMTTSVLLIGL